MTRRNVRIGLFVLLTGILGTFGVANPAEAGACATVAGWGHNVTTGYTYVSCSDGKFGAGYFAGASFSWLQQEVEEFCCPGELGNPMESTGEPVPSGG